MLESVKARLPFSTCLDETCPFRDEGWTTRHLLFHPADFVYLAFLERGGGLPDVTPADQIEALKRSLA